MRIRITRTLPPEYGRDIEGDLLLLGRVYNLAPPVASALMLDGYAELYDTLTAAEKREGSNRANQVGWTAHDREPRWIVARRRRGNS